MRWTLFFVTLWSIKAQRITQGVLAARQEMDARAIADRRRSASRR